MAPQIIVVKDAAALAQYAADYLVMLAERSIVRSGHFSLCLCGGSTPKALYELLGTESYAQRIAWQKTHVFWSDERCVAPDDAASNFHLAYEALLRHVPIQPSNIHRIRCEQGAALSAQEYERELRAFFPSHISFDLALLGLGEDGHTASVFPYHKAPLSSEAWVLPVEPAGTPRLARVTLTPAVLKSAKQVLFLVEGRQKSAALHAVLDGTYQPHALPAQAVVPSAGEIIWLVDEKAASQLAR